jgi:regulator of telomere elongation helicase 1
VARYNYLLDPAFRGSLGLAWQGAVVIFDEAHNVESVASDAASFDLR